jgi:hypothetical protein
MNRVFRMGRFEAMVAGRPKVTSLLAIALLAVPIAPGEGEELSSGSTAAGQQTDLTGDEYERCLAELLAQEVLFEPLGDVALRECMLEGAVKLRGVKTEFGSVSISGEPTLLCSFARQFAGWVGDVGAPLTLAYTGQKLALIETGPGFICRTRYDRPDEVLSEHAMGNAIDIASFVITDQTRIRVRSEPSDSALSRNLIRTLRTTACGYFTTVLGPGSNSSHADHLHFDLGLHGKTSNYRICE